MHISSRRAVQFLTLAGFLALYARTAYYGQDEITWPVHLAFKLDPLALLNTLIAGGSPSAALLLGGLSMVVATVILGRFFCGWLCPMGTTLDIFGTLLRRGAKKRRGYQNVKPPKYSQTALFITLLFATAAGLPLLAFLDPLSILLRSLTVSVFPAFDYLSKTILSAGMDASVPLSEPIFELMSEHILLLKTPVFLLAEVTAAIFIAIILLELISPRFWCTYLCPLGGLLGVISKFSPLTRARLEECKGCKGCAARCPNGAADTNPADKALCIQCMECGELCNKNIFGMRARFSAPSPSLPDRRMRRGVVASIIIGGGAALFTGTSAIAKRRGTRFLRPPGAVDEERFNKLCIRCGACMRVCPRNGIHPSLGEAGLDGLWSPRLVPRLGYCEYHCRLCGQVCPTGAIRYLAEGKKESWVIGIAVLDKNRCLPLRDGTPCIVCEEHCPTSPKAIEFEVREVTRKEGDVVMVKQPRIVAERCNGCGICENKCPLEGESAIRVERVQQEISSPYG
ncbi:MAG: hypothetical protein C0608_00255 [Deltaproteobacteria bacterium]|nr:MAG: hypothetical protein C0608_00255 [Deltaproteobacteria bacterium]